MQKIHMVGWALLLILLTTSALRVVVSTEEEALAELQKPSAVILKGKDCEIIDDAEKRAISVEELSTNPYVIPYRINYTLDGVNVNSVERAESATTDKADVQAAVAKACNEEWLQIQAYYSKPATEGVIIKPDLSSMTSETYDYIKKTWEKLGNGT